MAHSINTGTKEFPLDFANKLSEQVNEAWQSGEMLKKVSPASADLLRFWFEYVFCAERELNFHIGQKQAILNAIYCHEILKAESTLGLYESVDISLLGNSGFVANLDDKKYAHPKYCIKMATGTGKTWVLNALLIWQYLNASAQSGLQDKFGDNNNVKFSKNFLLVAPGLIVYERLIDSFCGKENEDGTRDFSSADICKNKELFLPRKYEEKVLSFIQNSVLNKNDIGRRRLSDGMIAITNWHLLIDEKEQIDEISPLKNPKDIVNDLLPIMPGTSGGNSLENLDLANQGDILGFLGGLENICVFNDEAHHIHENKSAGISNEVEWQKSLNIIAQDKGRNFIQIDFSATPYDVTGSGQKRQKHYFPHIISDFSLKEAIYSGLVKMIAIDKRKEFATMDNEEIEFKATRDENKKVIALSDGQKLMLSAGLSKLNLLETNFTSINAKKMPKMLVICEDTNVSPFVVEYLKERGLNDDEIMQIDSDKKGQVKRDEWKAIKQRLFNIDKHKVPKVIVSVLMLREGFDVNNICVIVPLRSSQAPILLEQVIGRGLRLMWRESDYREVKADNRERVLKQKQAPQNYFDILSIIEHPAYMEFYDDLDKEIVIEEANGGGNQILGDIINVGLRENYQRYDFYIPKIINPQEEILGSLDCVEHKFEKFFGHSLQEMLERLQNYQHETFQSQEMTIGTRFGDYKVDIALFNAKNYNEFLVKIANTANATKRAQGGKNFPLIQVNTAELARVVDKFIRKDLFGEEFDPLKNNNWRILMINKVGITQHIFKQINEFLYNAQQNINVKQAEIQKEYFSQVSELKMRENFTLDISKSIYERTPYPSNKGDFEKDFLEFCELDACVDKILKINEHYHTFAHCYYIRTDGLLASYCPDFIVQSKDNVYLIETKAQKDMSNENVKQKRKSAVAFCGQINELEPNDRMGAEWSYHLLDDKTFYTLKNRSTNLYDILKACEISYKNTFEQRLFENF